LTALPYKNNSAAGLTECFDRIIFFHNAAVPGKQTPYAGHSANQQYHNNKIS